MESSSNTKGKFGKSALDMKSLGELKGNKDVILLVYQLINRI